MGHMLKNTVFRSGSYALGVPQGTSSVGPQNPVDGQTRWNEDTNRLEFYGNITGTPGWNQVAREGNIAMTVDTFTGNSSNTEYGPMSFTYDSGSEAQVLVHVGTVYQIPVTNYTFYGNTTIHFTSAPSDSATITIVHGYASTVSTQV